MGNKIILLIILNFLQNLSYSQNQKKVDSLKTELQNAKQDTKRLRIYLELGDECATNDNLLYGEPALKLSDKLLLTANNDNERKKILKQKANALQLYYVYYTKYKNDNTKSLKYQLKRLSIFNEIEDIEGIINSLIFIATDYSHFKIDSAFYYAKGAESKIDKVEPRLQCDVYNLLAELYENKGRDDLRLEYYLKKLKVAKKNNLTEVMLDAYHNVIWTFYALGKEEKEFEYYELAITEAKKTKNNKLIVNILQTGQNLYFNIGDYDRVLVFQKEMLKYDPALLNDCWYIETYGDVYRNKKIYDSATFYYKKAVAIAEQKKDSSTIAGLYRNFATIPSVQNDYQLAIDYHLKAKSIYTAQKSFKAEAGQNKNIAMIYFEWKDNKKSLQYLNKSIEYDSLNKNYGELQDQYEAKSALLNNLKNYEGAYEYLKKSVEIKDSISNKETQNKLADLESSIVEEKKQKEIEIINKDKELQKTIRNSFIVGFGLMLLLAGVSYRNFRRKKKDNLIISKQKDIVEEKQKEILDSIEYALRIQTAILPQQKIVKQYLENSFILYKPKDIVAGDFYWMENINDLVLFAACDCTGHGVPGAMVSVVCHNALNRAVREFGLTQPAAILDKTAEIVIENFSKSEEDIKDGMDISLCAYNSKTKTIQWAGANNPLWLMQNGELIETKADKQPIGMNEDSKPFTNHTFVLNDGDIIYLFTDGFADQFGGETGEKKLTKRRFKDLLIAFQSKSIQDQGIALDKFITEYRKEIEQIDDILVMGVKV